MKRLSFRTVTPAILTALLLVSCLSTGTGTGIGPGEQDPARPEWMDAFPDSGGWYTGIAGVPWSGDESADRTAALAAARAEIAAAISVSVEQEIVIVQEESGSGSSFSMDSSVKENLRQSVQASLRDVEVVDTYYSEDSGFWVYARLSKERWEEIIREEVGRLRERVEGIVLPVLDDDAVPFATVLRQLAKARTVLGESSWAYLAEGNLGSGNGILMDLVDREVVRRLDGALIQAAAYEREIEYGDGAVFPVSVTSLSSAQAGPLPVRLTENGALLGSAVTGQEGRGEIRLDAASLAPGSRNFTASLDLEALGFSAGRASSYPEVSVALPLLVVYPEIALSMSLPGDMEGMGLETAVQALFSEKNLPLAFSSGRGTGGLRLEVSLQISDYPKYLENAPDMASALMRFTLVRDGQRLFSHESSSSKEGGLTPAQAHERATAALLRQLKSDDKLFTGLESALSAR